MSHKKMRLDKLIASMGFGSRKEVKIAMKKGEVTVNNKIIKDAGFMVDPIEHAVLYKNERVQYEEYQYYMLNKPAGVITATEDKTTKTIMDLMDIKHRKDLFPVGRLDKDTEGLLLITNDGDLCHNLLSPKKHVAKTYYAKIEGVVTQEDVKAFKEGVTLDTGYTTMPGELTIIDSGQLSEVQVIIQEGKFHQIKKMFEAVNKKVVYLKRIAMGKLKLDDQLELGQYRRLTDNELNLLKNE